MIVARVASSGSCRMLTIPTRRVSSSFPSRVTHRTSSQSPWPSPHHDPTATLRYVSYCVYVADMGSTHVANPLCKGMMDRISGLLCKKVKEEQISWTVYNSFSADIVDNDCRRSHTFMYCTVYLSLLECMCVASPFRTCVADAGCAYGGRWNSRQVRQGRRVYRRQVWDRLNYVNIPYLLSSNSCLCCVAIMWLIVTCFLDVDLNDWLNGLHTNV